MKKTCWDFMSMRLFSFPNNEPDYDHAILLLLDCMIGGVVSIMERGGKGEASITWPCS